MTNDTHSPIVAGNPDLSPVTQPMAQLTTYVRRNPGGTLLAVAGVGLITALLIRALTPPPPRHRAARLLEDLQERLADLAHPAYDRVSHLVGDGAHAVSKGVDRKFGRLGREFKNLIH